MHDPQRNKLVRGAGGALSVVMDGTVTRLDEAQASKIDPKLHLSPSAVVHQIQEDVAQLLHQMGFCIGPAAALCVNDPHSTG
jgi:hypothetical protein